MQTDNRSYSVQFSWEKMLLDNSMETPCFSFWKLEASLFNFLKIENNN